MSKSKLSESHKINVEGTLNITEDEEITMEIEDIGERTLRDILKNFNGCLIKLTANYGVELE